MSKILVIDDEPWMREMVRLALEQILEVDFGGPRFARGNGGTSVREQLFGRGRAARTRRQQEGEQKRATQTALDD